MYSVKVLGSRLGLLGETEGMSWHVLGVEDPMTSTRGQQVGVSKHRGGKPPKMDGLFHGKPY